MNANLNKRGKGGWSEGGYGQKPTYLTATAAEALGRIGGAKAEKAILAVDLPFCNRSFSERLPTGGGTHSLLTLPSSRRDVQFSTVLRDRQHPTAPKPPPPPSGW